MTEAEMITQLATKVTALTMLVEALWSSEIARTDDPKRFAASFLEHQLNTEASLSKSPEARKYAMAVTETLVSLNDRAVARALDLKGSGNQP